MKKVFILLILFYCGIGYSQFDYWAYQVYFSGCPINHIPKGIAIPDRDNKSRAIINAIIGGNNYGQLSQKYPDSLDIKLDKLITGKVLEKNKDKFNVLFPVIVGERRDKLQELIHKRIFDSGLSLDTIIEALRNALPGKQEMIFHLLWSRVIDDCWWNLYNTVFNTDKGPPSIAFIVYPVHKFQCGTNSDYSNENDMLAMSWSYNLFDESFAVPSSKSFLNLAVNKEISDSDKKFFRKYGLIDSSGGSRIFTFKEDDSLDSLLDNLKKIYISKVKDLFDFKELSKTFQIPADDLFIVASHEIAYEMLSMLYEKKPILIPIILKENPGLNFGYLTSVRLH